MKLCSSFDYYYYYCCCCCCCCSYYYYWGRTMGENFFWKAL